MSNTNAKTSREKLLVLTQLGILTAVIIVMALTPLGYLRIGTLAISLLMLPVGIGSIVCGPIGGAILGAVFGITSFVQCFGTDPFGTALMQINPVATFIMCIIARILAGYLAGLIFKICVKADKTKIISFAIATLSGAVFNTILFIGVLILFFGKSDIIVELQGGASLISFIIALVGINGLIEAVICCIVGGAVSKALFKFIPGNNKY